MRSSTAFWEDPKIHAALRNGARDPYLRMPTLAAQLSQMAGRTITSSAVYGRLQRMGLKSQRANAPAERVIPTKQRGYPYKGAAIVPPIVPREPQAAPPPRPASATPVAPTRICQWPFGHPREAGFRYCEATTVVIEGVRKSYCEAHQRAAYVRGSSINGSRINGSCISDHTSGGSPSPTVSPD